MDICNLLINLCDQLGVQVRRWWDRCVPVTRKARTLDTDADRGRGRTHRAVRSVAKSTDTDAAGLQLRREQAVTHGVITKVHVVGLVALFKLGGLVQTVPVRRKNKAYVHEVNLPISDLLPKKKLHTLTSNAKF